MKEIEIQIDAKELKKKLNLRDGKDAVVDYDRIKSEVLAGIPKPKDGEDGKSVDEEKLTKKLKKWLEKLIPEQDTMNQVGMTVGGGQHIRFLSNGIEVSAHVTEINFATGLTPVYDGNGRISVSGTSATTTYTETPTGDIDGVNLAYTTTTTITTVLNFNINGQYIHPSEYSFAGTTITFVTALDASLSGLPFTIVYQ